eukprot:1193590-Lingulodinium_polyedra.AAC.1
MTACRMPMLGTPSSTLQRGVGGWESRWGVPLPRAKMARQGTSPIPPTLYMRAIVTTTPRCFVQSNNCGACVTTLPPRA